MSAYGSFDAEEEKRRLRLQSEVMEPLCERALDRMGSLEGKAALDVACGAMGVLPALARRVGARGRVVGTDVNDAMLDRARELVTERGLRQVEIVKDDAYASALPARSFDLVHARFLLAPIGRDAAFAEQAERLAKPDGWILLEEPVSSVSQVFGADPEPHARLLGMIKRAYDRHMGGFDAGARLWGLAKERRWRDVHVDAQVVAMPAGHPYMPVLVMMARALRSALLRDTSEAELDAAVRDASALYARPDVCVVSFMLVQVWGKPPA